MNVFHRTKPYNEYGTSDIPAYNLRERMEYGLLELGAYWGARFDLPTSGYCTLKRTYDDVYGSGTVFEGLGPSWVWQDGFTYPSGSLEPLRASGVWVNNIFYSDETTGTFSHTIDFRNGRVIFDNNISESGVVKCEYLFNEVGVYTSDSRQWKTVV